jgi:thioredoxin 1
MIILFSQPSCVPCKAMKPIIQEILSKRKIALKEADVSTNDGMALAEKYGISTVPTLVFVDTKNPPKYLTGSQKRNEIERFLNNAF